VPAPSNPRKQSLMPASRLRKALRAAGHHLSPVVQVGKEGLTPAVTAALDEQLLAHELVKVKVGTESPEDRFEVAAGLAGLPGAQVAQVLGRTVLLYRKHPEKPRYEAADPATVRGKAKPAAERAPARRRPAPRRPAKRPARGR
jgi:RNA-binding protein